MNIDIKNILFVKYPRGNAYYITNSKVYYSTEDSLQIKIVHLLSGEIYDATKYQIGVLPWQAIPESYRRDAIAYNPELAHFEKPISKDAKEHWPYDVYIHKGNTDMSDIVIDTKAWQKQKDKLQQKTMNQTKNPLSGLLGNLGIEFGIVTDESVAISLKGLAFKGKSGYVTYDKENKQIIEIGDLKFDAPIMLMPVKHADLKEDDVIRFERQYFIVKAIKDQGELVLLNPTSGSTTTKVQRTNLFNMYYYTKVVSLMNFGGGEGKSILDNPMLLMMMSNGGGNGLDMNSIMMMSMFSGNNNPFETLFNTKNETKTAKSTKPKR